MNPLDQRIDQLPTQPGVYLFKDEKGAVLYVGKASSLKHRVNSYFQNPAGKDLKTLTMVGKVTEIETIVTDTEKEALILENHLIKEHRPRYNVKLRDDKTYPCLRLSIEEAYPTLCIVRRIKKDRSLYFGPYPSATSLRETLRLIRRLFPIRTCTDTKFAHRLRPCINHEMGRCAGPCCDRIAPGRYREIVHQVRMFLEGRNDDLVAGLNKKMEGESGKLNFEAAAKIRDQIVHIEKVIERQKIVSTDFLDKDVIGLHTEGGRTVIHPLFIRAGKLLGGKGFVFPSADLPAGEILNSFLNQYYREGRLIPGQILIPDAIPDQGFLEEWLTERKGKRVRILVPERGEKKRLLDLACGNAEKYLRAEADLEEDRERVLARVKETLHLSRVPRRIEAFDISNLQGKDAVGSMVVFEKGKASNDRYRHFRIKSVEGADDTGMMYEVLLRRYRKAAEEKDLPDLVLVDGGRGQLNVAQEVFRELNLPGVDLLGLAKGRLMFRDRGSRQGNTEEKVFHPRFKEPLPLGKHGAVRHFLDRIRDEAHRFAITYHKKVRAGETIRSVLREIPGIGAKRQKELLRSLGSVEKIREATLEDLLRVPKMNRPSAQKVHAFFHAEDNKKP